MKDDRTWQGVVPWIYGKVPAFRSRRFSRFLAEFNPIGKEKIRKLKEQHAFILGIPVTLSSKKASPLVVWEGSQKIVKHYFKKSLSNVDPNIFGKIFFISGNNSSFANLSIS